MWCIYKASLKVKRYSRKHEETSHQQLPPYSCWAVLNSSVITVGKESQGWCGELAGLHPPSQHSICAMHYLFCKVSKQTGHHVPALSDP